MERKDWYALSALEEIGPVKVARLIDAFGREADYFNIEEKELIFRAFLSEKDAKAIRGASNERGKREEEYFRMEESGTHMLLLWDDKYPERLKNLPDTPVCLFVRGTLPPENEPTAAIIGARQCSSFGRNLTFSWAKELAEAGCGIVSGMAKGIDGSAHRGALSAEKGKTYAILGNGTDICYPAENRDIFEQIPEKGALISEFSPGTKAQTFHFPRRNRLISAFSDVVAVMEARKKSGTLITVGYALEQGKEVLALPGRIGDELSGGTLDLLRDGAGLLTEPEDILRILKKWPEEGRCEEAQNAQIEKIGLAEPDITVYSCIDFMPKHVDEIVKESALSYPQVCSSLLSLELIGKIRQTSGSFYYKT